MRGFKKEVVIGGLDNLRWEWTAKTAAMRGIFLLNMKELSFKKGWKLIMQSSCICILVYTACQYTISTLGSVGPWLYILFP